MVLCKTFILGLTYQPPLGLISEDISEHLQMVVRVAGEVTHVTLTFTGDQS